MQDEAHELTHTWWREKKRPAHWPLSDKNGNKCFTGEWSGLRDDDLSKFTAHSDGKNPNRSAFGEVTDKRIVLPSWLTIYWFYEPPCGRFLECSDCARTGNCTIGLDAICFRKVLRLPSAVTVVVVQCTKSLVRGGFLELCLSSTQVAKHIATLQRSVNASTAITNALGVSADSLHPRPPHTQALRHQLTEHTGYGTSAQKQDG